MNEKPKYQTIFLEEASKALCALQSLITGRPTDNCRKKFIERITKSHRKNLESRPGERLLRKLHVCVILSLVILSLISLRA